MILKIRYENEFQTIELDTEAASQLWISLSLEGEDLSEEEREQRIQDAFDDQFNKPEYNQYHRETRHIDPNPKRKRMDGKRGYIQCDQEDTAFDIMDYLLTESEPDNYEETCLLIRKVLAKKPAWADALIAVRLDGETIREYAGRIGASENNISQKLKRAEKKMKEFFENRQI